MNSSHSVSQRESHFADLDLPVLLRAAPVWMLRAAEAAQVLPLHRQLFDLVIFDEATQCDIASALPVSSERSAVDAERGGGPPTASQVQPDDGFLREVTSRLELDGARVWPDYSIAGMKVDAVVEKGGRCLGIDLVGFPGRFAGSFDLERYRIFNRAGLRLMPLPYSAWLRDAVGCVEAIESRLAS